MTITGENLIGEGRSTSEQLFQAIDPATGAALPVSFSEATPADVARACALAADAAATFRHTAPALRADLLEAIASELEADGEALVARAMAESGLPRARLEGERGRTTGQLRMFANLLHRGDYLDIRIDSALPDRAPAPRPDLRQMRISLGPVAVFGASNFPLAFSTAGGDTASALAAGCPVVVKGHPSHPGTCEIAGRAIQRAIARLNLPQGVFSLVQGQSREVGEALVSNPFIQAVGFTGSRQGGLALLRLAQSRPCPIPFYAEMSSINPVFLMPAALAARAETIATGFVGSLTLGAGQFCTNPGLVLAVEGEGLDRFIAAARTALIETGASLMLNSGISAAYQSGVAQLEASADLIARGKPGTGQNQAQAALFETTAHAFKSASALSNEVFGPSSLIVRCKDVATLTALAAELEGQLTATLHLDDADHLAAQTLIDVLETRAGRILVNGWPTGVEVSPAMVHGGPFPATSDSRTTSVGTAAIERFLRPVCYQNLPDNLLPAEIRQANPYGFARLVDGVVTR